MKRAAKSRPRIGNGYGDVKEARLEARQAKADAKRAQSTPEGLPPAQRYRPSECQDYRAPDPQTQSC